MAYSGTDTTDTVGLNDPVLDNNTQESDRNSSDFETIYTDSDESEEETSTMESSQERAVVGDLGKPAPVEYTMSPLEEIRQNVMRRRNMTCGNGNTPSDSPRATISFIVCGRPEDVEGVVKAVYEDLRDSNQDANIHFDETVPCIVVDAPTEEDAMRLVRTAQHRAASYISPSSSETKSLFVEPPANRINGFQIIVGKDPATGCVCHRLQAGPEEMNSTADRPLDRYNCEISEAIYTALREISTLNSSIILRATLGHYRLQNYKPGNFTLREFEEMVRHPRATGRFDTRLGGVGNADRLGIETVMKLIQAADTSLGPTNNQTPTAAQVVPIYIFEASDDDSHYEANINIQERGSKVVRGPPGYKLMPVKRVSSTLQPPRFEIVSMAVGRELDWKITAMSGSERSPLPERPLVQRGLDGATCEMKGLPNDLHSYPIVALTPEGYNTLQGRLKSVTMKSIYRYKWKASGYMVEFTINRQWRGITKMSRDPPSDIDFELTMYGGGWDNNSKVKQAGETVGKFWHDDLRGLLVGEAGNSASAGVRRVQVLVDTMRDIRNFFDDASRVQD
ncbi:hypothetical protein GGS20DRAFT_585327 [Poronia punctata]|nr:hypothetical protein GGS20DRAFT_585327 [Poronia punctata]